MIALVLSMLRARRWPAIILTALSMFAVAAAVAAPAYLRAVDRAVVASEVGAASSAERGLTIGATVDVRNGSDGLNLIGVGSALVNLPRFTEVSASEYRVVGVEADPKRSSRLTSRQDVCAHLVMATGRCLIGAGEVIVGADTAQRLHLTTGATTTVTFATFSTDPRTPWYLPDGTPKPVAIVGTFRTPAPDDQYWGTHGYFAVDGNGQPTEPVFTNAATLAQIDHGAVLTSIDAMPTADTFTVDNLPGVRDDVSRVTRQLSQAGPSLTVSTAIPQLLARIDQGRKLAHQSVPVVAVPLILLACFVIFLAAGYGVDARRPELAVVALRGTRWPVRWWLAIGESLVPILVGALAGCLAGQLAVGLLVLGRFPDVHTTWFSLDALRYAPIAAFGAVLAALLAQWQPLRGSVADLLRRIPSRARGWQPIIAELAVTALAVVAAGQLWLSHGALVGVGLFAPALVIMALVLLASRALVPLANRYGNRSLRRGRLAPALAAFSLARRRGARRLFVLLAGAVAILGFAACAIDVAAQDREVAARISTGATRVLSIGDTTRQQLLHAVRTVDPDARYAMAVARLPVGAPGEAPKLAVDSAALPAVAAWQSDFGPLDASTVARLLHPAAPDPILVPGQDVSLDLDVTGSDANAPVSLTVVLSPAASSGTIQVGFGVLHNGPYTYQQRTPGCLDGCRLVGFHLTTQGNTALRLSLTLRSLGTVNPTRVSATPADFATVARWRLPAGGKLTAVPEGLRADFTADDALADGGWVQPTDAPFPLPVVSTAVLPDGATIAGLDDEQIPVTEVGRVTALPRLGTKGTLVDLEYADRSSTDVGTATAAEVWLGPSAPSDVVARLAGQGLVITGDIRRDAARERLDEQGPALALRFFLLVAVLAIVLAVGGLSLVAALDRRARAAELSALRAQGLDVRTVRRTLLWGYPAVSVVAGLFGLVTALVSWRLTGWALPVFSTPQPALALPYFPRALGLIVPGGAAVAVLTAVALLIGRDLRRLLHRTFTDRKRP